MIYKKDPTDFINIHSKSIGPRVCAFKNTRGLNKNKYIFAINILRFIDIIYTPIFVYLKQ